METESPLQPASVVRLLLGCAGYKQDKSLPKLKRWGSNFTSSLGSSKFLEEHMGWEISLEPYLENTIFHKTKEMSKQQEAGITGSFIVQDLTLKH